MVRRDANGLLVVATQGTAEGVIWTPEGKASTAVANYYDAAIGSKMTVFMIAQFTDIEGDAGLTDGAVLWSTAGGDVVFAAPGTGTVQKVGFVCVNDTGVDSRLVINVPLAD